MNPSDLLSGDDVVAGMPPEVRDAILTCTLVLMRLSDGDCTYPTPTASGHSDHSVLPPP
jgi:hypothetical protein